MPLFIKVSNGNKVMITLEFLSLLGWCYDASRVGSKV